VRATSYDDVDTRPPHVFTERRRTTSAVTNNVAKLTKKLTKSTAAQTTTKLSKY